MLKRPREGIAKAKVDGKYLGRAPTGQVKVKDIKALCATGVWPLEITMRLGAAELQSALRRHLNCP